MITLSKPEQFTIDRDNAKRLRFKGERIASASTRWLNGREQNRFNEITVYRTTGGNYVLHEEYITFWQGESCSSEAAIYKTPQDLIDALGELNKLTQKILDALGPCFEAGLIEEVD